jgi:hypothetical protein
MQVDIDVLEDKLKDVAAQEAIARMGKRVEKAERNVGAATKKRKTKKPDRLNVKKMRGHKQY